MSRLKVLRRRGRPRKLKRVPGATYDSLERYIDETGDTEMRIAERVGVSQAHISRIRLGKCMPRPDVAKRLARYTGVSVAALSLAWLRRHGNRRRLQRSA